MGFRTDLEKQTDRPTASDSTPAIRLDIWYPAELNEEPPMRFGDYVRHELGAATGEDSLKAWLAAAVTGDPAGLSLAVSGAISSPMRARLNAPRALGRHHLLLWAPRHETTPAQSVLSEYLASHGYVVVASRREGARLPYPWEMKTDDERHATIREHMSDMRRVVRALRVDTAIAFDRLGVLTWSYAAEMASLLQMETPEVAMVVGLSSDPFAEPGVYRTGVAAEIPSTAVPATYVVMTESTGPDGVKRQAPRLLRQLRAESYFVRFHGLSHGNFNVLEGMIPGVFGIADVQPWSRGERLLGADTRLSPATSSLSWNTACETSFRGNRCRPANSKGMAAWSPRLDSRRWTVNRAVLTRRPRVRS